MLRAGHNAELPLDTVNGPKNQNKGSNNNEQASRAACRICRKHRIRSRRDDGGDQCRITSLPPHPRAAQGHAGCGGRRRSTGFDNHFWGVVVNNEGVVCAVAHSGETRQSQWIASRQIAAAKAFTAYGLSLDIGTGTGALSTAQLYSLVQPGIQPGGPAAGFAPLFGLAGGNVLDSAAAYKGQFHLFGTANDPMVGERVGGTITFGDTACADHSVAWRTRLSLGLQQPAPQTTG